MIVIPFVYFGLLLIWSINRNGLFCIGSYILLLYTIISFMSIVLDLNNYYSPFSCHDLPISPFASILYCTLLTICMAPFLRKPAIIIPYTSPKTGKLLDIMTFFYFSIFVIVLFVSLSRLQYILTSNQLSEIRGEQYRGEIASFYNHLSGLPRYICALCSIVAPSGYIMTLIFMYNIAFRKKSILFNVLTLAGSFSQLIIAINIVDRSNFAYWFLLIGLGFFIFYPYFSKKAKIGSLISIILLAVAFISYIVAVTESRFGMRADGAIGGVINYLGQSYINFCHFIDYIVPENSLCEIFPLITNLTGGDTYFIVADKVYAYNNGIFGITVFSTFLGLIYSVSGGFILACFIFIYNRISSYFIKKTPKFIELSDLIREWALSLVLVLGLFGYYYGFMNCTIALIIWFIISSIINPPAKLRKIHISTYSKKSIRKYENTVNRPIAN